MNQTNRARLLKVLALADSSHDGEAVAAVRVAKQLLKQSGLSFCDLAKTSAPFVAFATEDSTRISSLEAQIASLQKRLAETESQLQEKTITLKGVRARAELLEMNAEKNQSEVEKWRNLARDTANKLWDIGQQIAEDRAVSSTVAGQLQDIRPTPRPLVRPPSPPSSLSRERHFVRNSLIEAQESTPQPLQLAGK